MAKHILIIGSPGSGKSVFSAALASAAGKRKKQTLLISGDSRISMLSFFCGNTDTDGLGTLYAERLHRSVPQMQSKSCANFRISV